MSVMDWFLNMLNVIRERILEALVIPGLGISWWHFCIIILVLGIVITALINAVRVSSGSLAYLRSEDARYQRYQARRLNSKQRNSNQRRR